MTKLNYKRANGIEPSSLDWKSKVITIIRRPRCYKFDCLIILIITYKKKKAIEKNINKNDKKMLDNYKKFCIIYNINGSLKGDALASTAMVESYFA